MVRAKLRFALWFEPHTTTSFESFRCASACTRVIGAFDDRPLRPERGFEDLR